MKKLLLIALSVIFIGSGVLYSVSWKKLLPKKARGKLWPKEALKEELTEFVKSLYKESKIEDKELDKLEALVEKLEKKGVKINDIKYPKGMNLLGKAAMGDNPELIERLLQQKQFEDKITEKKFLNHRDALERTPLMIALSGKPNSSKIKEDPGSAGRPGYLENKNNIAVDIIGAGADVELKDKMKKTAFHYAAENGFAKAFKYLINALNEKYEEELGITKEEQKRKVIKNKIWFLESERDKTGKTIMQYIEEGIRSSIGDNEVLKPEYEKMKWLLLGQISKDKARL